MQYAKFPMKYVNVTQVPNNNFSHKGSMSAWDNAGKDTGIDDAFAPFDAEIVWKDTGSAKTGVLITNTVEVKCADGQVRKPKTINLLLWHDNNISDLSIGQKLKQGQIFYQEGTAGRATGNHVHFNVGIGAYRKGTYPLVENEFKVWEIKGEIDPTKIFFIDDSNIVTKTNGMKWIKYEVPKEVVKEEVQEVSWFKVGDKVKITGTHYATGQAVPSFVKSKVYTIQQVKPDRALLKEIYSWVYLKDLRRV